MAVNIGTLRHPITLQQQQQTGVDAQGRRILAWVDVAHVMAAMRDVSGYEFFEAAAHQMQNVTTFTLRWRDGLGTDMRVLYGGQAYEVLQVNHLGYRRDFVQLKTRVIESEATAWHGSI